MNTTVLWIVIAVIVIALIIAGIVVAGNKRKASKTVSFEKPEEPKQLTQQEKSGNYQAKGGFNFAQVDAQPKQPEPIRRERPASASAAAPSAEAAAQAEAQQDSVIERAIGQDGAHHAPAQEEAKAEPVAESVEPRREARVDPSRG